jgi:hypothetical protein
MTPRVVVSRHVLCMLSTVVLLAAATAPGAAGTIDPAYEAHLNTLPADEMVSVLVYLADQAPVAALDARLRAERATLPARHATVVNALRDVAAATQSQLLADLETRRIAGQVRGYMPYWITNVVAAEMTVAAVRAVATRPDVSTIESNFTVSLIAPVGGTPPAPPPGAEPRLVAAATPGLHAINAHRVWYELGITGAGRLVCGLDTGVHGAHVALASRWRGNHVPWQQAWLDVLGTNTEYPVDADGHGTHTMGTITGLGVATGDTVGVAFGAEWIACNAIDQGVNPDFDNDIIAAFQWIADPDGNPNTTGDVPDVVQNSWGINESFGGNPPYTDCDQRWWAVIDACEAAGCAVVFSAGNEGSDPGTIRSPADRITTPTNALAVGAVSARAGEPFPFAIAGFSSRGPSGCPGTPTARIKPEVSAPGVDVYSTLNTGGYGAAGFSGTSMAGPHVAGIIALMREADPNLDVTTMKQIIMDTARDLGPAGEDNAYGWGIPDAFVAVSAVMPGSGEVTGTVTHSTLGIPIPGATVAIVEAGRTFTTNAHGVYRAFAPAGTYTVTASHPAYLTGAAAGVVITASAPSTQDFALAAAPDPEPPVITGITCLYGTDDPIGPYAFEAIVTDNLFVAQVSLFYRTTQSWIEVPMAELGNDRYAGAIPGQPLGTIVEFYLRALDAALNEGLDPPGAPRRFVVAEPALFFADDVESPQGWTLGLAGDTATRGRWERGDPPGTFLAGVIPVQPEDDHTPAPGVQCFVTELGHPGEAYNVHDVDGGCTTLLSPRIDLGGAQEAVLRYWRWWFGSSDTLHVDVSADDGATWSALERVTGSTSNTWTEASFPLACTCDLTATMRIRFRACDLGLETPVEAALDDVSMLRYEPGTTGLPAAAPVAAPGGLRVTAVQPNPFNPATLVLYEVPARGEASLRVYDASGRCVRVLVDGVLAAGSHVAAFDGRNDAGRDLASGTYFLRLTADGETTAGKLNLVR